MKQTPFRLTSTLAAALCAVALVACNDHSLSLDITPNPLIVGLFDRQATIHARAVAKGFGKVPFTSVQFAVFNGADSLIASQTEEVDRNIPASPFGYVVEKNYTFPINGAAVALTGTRYIMVKILDPSGNVVSQRRLDIVVHALKDAPLPIPPVIKESDPTPKP